MQFNNRRIYQHLNTGFALNLFKLTFKRWLPMYAYVGYFCLYTICK